MNFLTCQYCFNFLKNPIQCNNCEIIFCKEHINNFNKCPRCNNSPFNPIEIYKSKKILEEYKREKSKNKIFYEEDIVKCTLCGFEERSSYFCYHLIENHKANLIDVFGIKIEKPKTQNETILVKNLEDINEKREVHSFNNDKIKNEKNINNNKNELNKNNFPENFNKIQKMEQFENYYSNYNNNKEFSIFAKDLNSNSFNNNSTQNENYIFQKQNSEEINMNTFPENRDDFFKIDELNLKSKSLNQNQKINIYYCGKINKIINCDCCPDRICRPGNCLCVNCMKVNINNLKLKNRELINKAGRIAEYENGQYHCNKDIKIEIKSLNNKKLIANKKCGFLNAFCDECKILSKYQNIYFQNMYLK